MSHDVTLLLTLIILGAGWLFVHVLLLARCLRAPGLSRGFRLLALLPVATPVVGWYAGARVLSAIWIGCGVLYTGLQALA
jgi:hypothetical protein